MEGLSSIRVSQHDHLIISGSSSNVLVGRFIISEGRMLEIPLYYAALANSSAIP